MSHKFGIVAEDETDYLTLREIVHRVLGRHISTRRRVGNGASKIRQKAGAWLSQLAAEGCTAAIVVHDLDRNPLNNALNNESELRLELESVCAPAPISRLICIPVEEIEAWFWADPGVVAAVGRGTGKASSSPANIARPKEALRRLSMGANAKPRYDTNDNPVLAKILDIETCRTRCPSFAQLMAFLERSLR